MTARVQHPAPDFAADAVHNGDFVHLKLSDFAGKYLVLFFYPLDFTFVCPTEILAFGEKEAEFKARNAALVGCSVDSKYSHFAWLNTPKADGGIEGVQFPLLADLGGKIATDYGVINDEHLSLRGTFIIDPKQRVRVAMINDAPIGRNIDEVIRLLDAVQFHDKNGEVCPANWTKGAATMKDNPKDSKEYFKKVNA